MSQTDRTTQVLAERKAEVRRQLKNSVYRTLVSLVSAMAKHMTPREALDVIDGEMSVIRVDIIKAEKKAVRRTERARQKEAKKVCMIPACGCDGKWHA